MSAAASADRDGASRTRALRAGVVAALAGAYLAALWAFAGKPTAHAEAARSPMEPASSAAARPSERAPPPGAGPVWYEDLPAAQRPTVALPPGWRIAGRSSLPAAEPAVRAPAPVTAKTTRPRAHRLRTRSS